MATLFAALRGILAPDGNEGVDAGMVQGTVSSDMHTFTSESQRLGPTFHKGGVEEVDSEHLKRNLSGLDGVIGASVVGRGLCPWRLRPESAEVPRTLTAGDDTCSRRSVRLLRALLRRLDSFLYPWGARVPH